MPRSFALLGLIGLAPIAAHAQINVPATPAGASRTVLALDSIDLTAVRTLAELLQARVPGLVVTAQSGSAGAAARVGARGVRSVYEYGDPLLVIDGVRAVGAQRGFEIDDAVTISRLDDVVLEHVERIEVLLGPAAAAAYGPGAANGAIVVTTRTGTSGPARLRAYAQASAARDRAEYPLLYRGVGVGTNGAPRTDCTTTSGCTSYRIEGVRPFAALPSRTAAGATAGVTAAGGSARARWWLGADARSTPGVLEGNDARRLAARANVTLDPSPGTSLALRVGASRAATDLRPGDQLSFVDAAVLRGLGLALAAAPPARQDADRIDASVRGEQRVGGATFWVAGGLSDVHRREAWEQGAPTASIPGGPALPAAASAEGDGHAWVASGEAGVDLRARVGAAATTTGLSVHRLGERTVRFRERRTTGSSRTQWSSFGLDSWALRGAQTVAIGDRVFVDGTVRWNAVPGRLSAGEANVDGALAASWAPLGARGPRLRSAWGASSVTRQGQTLLGLLWLGAVRPGVSPFPDADDPSGGRRSPAERTTEVEGGVDVPIAGRAALRVTAFGQRSRGVAMGVSTAAPGLGGASAGPMTYGAVRNAGGEATLDGTLLARPSLGLTARLSAGWLHNRVQSVADPRYGDRERSGGAGQPVLEQRLVAGVPLGTYHYRAFTVRDDDGNGLATANEVRTSADAPLVAAGSTLPTRLGAAELRGRWRRTSVALLAEYRGGHATAGGRPALVLRGDRALVDSAAPLRDQAAARDFNAQRALLVQDADFIRLRELAVSHAFGASRAHVLTVAARNLYTATRFDGTDPETTANPLHPLAAGGYLIQPLPATLSVRLATAF